MKLDKKEVKSILFITLTNLGDIILTTPVLERLCDEFPGARVDVITGPAGKEIFLTHPAVRELIVYKKGASLKDKMSQFFYLCSKGHDLVIDMKRSLAPYFIGSKVCVGALSFIKPTHRKAVMHKREEHLSVLKTLGIDPFVNNRFFLPVSNYDKTFIDGFMGWIGEEKNVVINPGAKSHLKRWDAGKFATLADRLISELGCKIFITGNERDAEIVNVMLSNMKNKAFDLCGKTSIGSLAELMRRSSLVITGDSAPLHVASGVNAPTIAIFGPSNEKKYGPLSDRNKVIKPDVPCRPCEKALCRVGPTEGCLSKISVEEVFKAAKEMLEG